jgi:hypothetical protein
MMEKMKENSIEKRNYMPSLATHYLFGQDVMQKTNEPVRNTIEKSIGAFYLGLQGPDIFFYYLAHAVIARNHNIGKFMHAKRSDLFFYKYIHYLNDHKLNKNAAALSYFYGMLCHYSLDCIAHPYIYYFTNLHDKSNSGIRKSLDSHVLFESGIDELLYHDRTSQNICDIKRSVFMNISKSEIAVISPIIAYSISETYKCDISANFVKGSIRRCRTSNAMLNNRLGIKRVLIGNIEKKLMGNHFTKYMMYTRKLPSRSCLNENHQEWHFPTDNKELHLSFMDLYHFGMNNALDLIEQASQVMNGKCSISSFIQATGGKSYHTGTDWRLEHQMIYFKSEN